MLRFLFLAGLMFFAQLSWGQVGSNFSGAAPTTFLFFSSGAGPGISPVDSVTTSRGSHKKKYPNPNVVALKSAIIPGWGQAVNGQIWKVPIIYAGVGVISYFVIDNNRQYLAYRDAYRLRRAGRPDPYPLYSENNLLEAREYYRRNRDLSVIVGVGIYAANILDAYVYAQLRDWDVSPDLSMSLVPQIYPIFASSNGFAPALSINFHFNTSSKP